MALLDKKNDIPVRFLLCSFKWCTWKQFLCKKGVRQGDPLSPLLFVIATDVLQTMLNEAMAQNLIRKPIAAQPNSDFPVIQYADDDVMIIPACEQQLEQLKNILMHFTVYTGLRINYEKSVMVPINTSDNHLEVLASRLGCKIGSIQHMHPSSYMLQTCGFPKLHHHRHKLNGSK